MSGTNRFNEDEKPIDPYRLPDEVRKLFAKQKTVAEIVKATGMNEQTVKNIYQKLGRAKLYARVSDAKLHRFRH